MHIPRLYYTKPLKRIIELSQDESRHLKALRLRSGDFLELFNGKGRVSDGELMSLGKNAKIRIIKTHFVDEISPEIILWTAIPKGDRADWLIEKAAELGVTKIVPIIFRYSVTKPKKNKLERWKRLSIAACAQSKRAYLPEITNPIKYNDILKKIKDEQLIVCHQDGKSIKDLKLKNKIILIVGPEGGFDLSELKALNKAKKINLGKNILRTETAAVIAVGLLRVF